MKNLKVITIFTIFLIAMSGSSLLAQGRQSNTSSARAAYGYPSSDYKAKKKKKSKKKTKQRKATKKKNSTQPLYRKKNPWAN